MGKKTEKKSIKVAMEDIEFKKSVDDLANAITDDLEKSYQSDLEPLEAYVNKVRSQLHEDMDTFRNRFLNGYQILLEELEKEKKDKHE